MEDTTMHRFCPEQRLISSMVAAAIEAHDFVNAWKLSEVETKIYGAGICHCPNCGRILGAFPPGVVGGWRYGYCHDCERERGHVMDPVLFCMRRGRVDSSYYGCGHEYRHGDGEVMKYCPACTGKAPPLCEVT